MAGKRLPEVTVMRENSYEVLAAFKLGPLTTSAVHKILPTQTQGRVAIELRNVQEHVQALTAAGLLEDQFPSAVVNGHIKFLHRLTDAGLKKLKEQSQLQNKRQLGRQQQEELARHGSIEEKVAKLQAIIARRKPAGFLGVSLRFTLEPPQAVVVIDIDDYSFQLDSNVDFDAFGEVIQSTDYFDAFEPLFDQLCPPGPSEDQAAPPNDTTDESADEVDLSPLAAALIETLEKSGEEQSDDDPEREREADMPLTVHHGRDEHPNFNPPTSVGAGEDTPPN